MMRRYLVTLFVANLIQQTVQDPERRYACWGSFGPPVISAQCPRGTVIQVLKAGLKVKRGNGPCVYKDGDCGCEYGEPACNMDRVRERCMGRPACRLDVTQQYINTPTCTGFSDYMYIEFNCVPMETKTLHDICVTDVAVSKTGFIRSPNYPNKYPKNRYCLCNLRTLPEHSIKVSVLDLNRQSQGQECIHSKVLLQHDKDKRLLCDGHIGDMRQVDTGRSAITVVMETDDVATSGGFWLKYEALPEAMVQMECFGEFAKEERHVDKKPKLAKVTINTRSSITGDDELLFGFQNSSAISNDSTVQSTGSLAMTNDTRTMIKRLRNTALPADNDKKIVDVQLPNKAIPENEAEQTDTKTNEKPTSEDLLPREAVLFESSSAIRDDAGRAGDRQAVEERLFSFVDDNSEPAAGSSAENKSMTDEEFDSIIQTILKQFEEASEQAGDGGVPDDDIDEEILVNIAQLMANELKEDQPAAELASAATDGDYEDVDTDYVVPLEYDSLEELLARDRLQIRRNKERAQMDNTVGFDYGRVKPRRKTTGPRHAEENSVPVLASIERTPAVNSVSRRKNVRPLQNDNNRMLGTNERTEAASGTRDGGRSAEEKPWWFKFILKDAEETRRERQPISNPSQTFDRNIERRVEGKNLHSMQFSGERRNRGQQMRAASMAPSEDFGPPITGRGILGDSPRLVGRKHPALPVGNRQYPDPPQSWPVPGEDEKHVKVNKVVDVPPGKSTQEDKRPKPKDPEVEDSMTVTLIAAGVIGSVLLVVIVGVLIKYAVKRSNPRPAWRRRHPPSVLRRHPYLHKHPSLT